MVIFGQLLCQLIRSFYYANLRSRSSASDTWILRFVPDDLEALSVAYFWKDIVSSAFINGIFNERIYEKEYRKHIPRLNYNERLINISQFYMVSLLKGLLDDTIEDGYINYIINNQDGIYYVYDSIIIKPPEVFQSKVSVRYLSALELLSGYSCARDKLQHAIDWLYSNQDKNGQWDFGPKGKDGIYFPVSESWRKVEDRKADCTQRVKMII